LYPAEDEKIDNLFFVGLEEERKRVLIKRKLSKK